MRSFLERGKEEPYLDFLAGHDRTCKAFLLMSCFNVVLAMMTAAFAAISKTVKPLVLKIELLDRHLAK